MKKIYKTLYYFLLLVPCFSFAGESADWTAKFEPQKVFIENRGQFRTQATPGFDSKVAYAFDGNGQNIYFFTKSGVIFQLAEIKKAKDKDKDREESPATTAEQHEKMEREERQMTMTKEVLQAQWIGSNPDVQIIAEGLQSAYHSYSFKDGSGKTINENQIPAFTKLTYKDLYPNIDVVYEMHPQAGIKYSVVVHPGGDIFQVRLKYSKKAQLLSDGNIKTKSIFGDFIDHAPSTFYADDKSPVSSSYHLKGNVISFSVGTYDPTKTIVIDPWTQTPSFSGSGGWQCVWECQKDAAGNAYLIGGVTPMQLLKYNSAGTLQWTYNTPYDTSSWLGTFAVDNAGNSYVTCGSTAAIQKVNTAGSLVWNNANPGGVFTSTEFWSISFNCDQTQLVIGGTGGFLPPLPYIYNMDMNTGNVLNSVQVTGGALLPTQEVRAITACGNGNYYYLTHDSIGYIHQGLTSCLPPGSVFPFHVSSGTNFAYKCEDWRVNNTGIRALRAFGGYVYVNVGNQVQKRAFNTGAIIATANIPGGAYTVTLGAGAVSNSGIDIDTCGDVFVGSTNGVVKYDANLNQLATFSTSFHVYDVVVSPTGAVIAGGSTGNQNSGARSGYLQSFAANACPTIAIVCCDATICPHASVCTSDAPFNLTSTTSGGVWSGTGITNTANGTFSPALSGVGTFTVYYTLPCGRDSTVITVNSCTSTSVCRNANGTLTVSGGTAPYTWSIYDSTGQVCVGGVVLFGICTGTWGATYGWTTFATGPTATPPAPVTTDTIKVVDNAGTTIVINNVSTVPPCNACNLAIQNISPTNPTCGSNNGSATVNITAGTGTAPLHYRWSRSGSDTLATISNLAAGTYTVTVTDAGACSATATVTLTVTGSLSLTTSSTPASCGNSNGSATVNVVGGSGTYTYTWSVAGSTATLNNLSAGNYTVTVTQGGCSGVTSVSVTSSNGVSASLASQVNVNCYGASTGKGVVSASGGTLPYTYTWSAGGSTVDSAVNLAAGPYSVTVKDANNCTSLITFTITQPLSALSVSDTTRPAFCGNNTGKVYITASGGTPTYTYAWSPNVSTNDSAVGLTANTYLVTVTDANHCTQTVTATVQPAAGAVLSLVSKQDVTCHGDSTGKIDIGASGGAAPYTYVWSPSVSTTDSAVHLAQGTYSVTSHDANGCTSSLTVTINQPVAIVVTTTTIQANCGVSNGSTTAIVTGGVGTLAYHWSAGSSITAIDNGLPAGAYTVTVTDSTHCTATGTAAISNIGAPAATIASQVNVNCNGGNTGKIVISVTGGTSPYTYTWSPNVSTVDSALNLTAGLYNITVHDASSCIAVLSATITQPLPLSASVQSVNTNCGQSTGWAKINVSGGTGRYSYVWSVPQTSDSITLLAGGKYYVTVSDSLGCTLTDSVVVGTNSGPLAPSITAGGPVTFCQGDSVVLTSTAATGNTWSTTATTQSITVSAAGTYTVTQTVGSCTSPPSASVVVTVNPVPAAPVITASGPLSFCMGDSVTLTSSAVSGNLWSSGQTIQSIVVKSGGTYTVSDTQNACPSPASAPVTVAIIPSPQPLIAASQHAICPGSTLTLDATTASATSYLWSTNAATPSISVTSAGFYQVTVTVGGCTGTDTITISSQPALGPLSLSDTSICEGDFVTLDATTTNATNYMWSGPVNATTPAVTVDSQGVYHIRVSNICGFDTGSVTITFKDCECRIVMPNAFTPNGDGVNDTYGPNFQCDNPKYLMMSIFNRWGEKVFETSDLNGQWDGKYKGAAQPAGVYVYYVEFAGLQNNAEKTYHLMGSLTIIR